MSNPVQDPGNVTVQSTSMLKDPMFYTLAFPVVASYLAAEFGIHIDGPTTALAMGLIGVVGRYFSNRPVHVPGFQSARFLRLPGSAK